MNDSASVPLLFAGILIAPFIFGFLCNLALGSIKNASLRKILAVIFFVLFLPGMLAFWNAANLTKSEKELAPFSLSLHVKSRLVLITLAVYAFGYYHVITAFIQ